MASKSDMKGFYKQQKKGGISKAKPKSKTASSSTPKHSATSGAYESPAIGSLDLHDQYGENENMLSQFDMNMAYGPCLGMSRLERWERAKALGLNPPNDLLCLLEGQNVRKECLWDCRV